ncbi:beta-glucosidase BglX [Reichenbachiella carrageenanivorans]|uniref:beta-glucosidase n=1 Tax=Reichenbachiella carrageenanivorans TaxID=2979869 RepID=A0ABY6CZ23_9BACT|nr:beta-glucosidase BglX [Reichenbachiella carrageenanivorans]UXX79161.1 beta-glucosidase BglX [Reichenbachiella carrageenanivorans]
MKVQTAIVVMAITLTGCGGNMQKKQSTTGPFAAQVDSLMSLMTLEEKAGQLNLYAGSWEFTGPVPKDVNNQQKFENIKSGKVGAMLNVITADGTREAQKLAVENSRLGIPLLFGYDVIHGYKTMMPIPLGQAASWDAGVAKSGAAVAAKEAAASGINWTFAPMMDIARDARWGRMMESPGEDPYLASYMSKAWIEGFQGSDLSDIATIAACAKHFAAYGFAEAGRDYNTVDISMQTLYNMVLPPFKAASEAGVASFMNSFNEIGGVSANGSVLLQRELLKGAWNYQNGFVVSDWGSIGEMITHGYAADTLEAGYKALTAGSDMDMEAHIYENSVEELVSTGQIDENILNDAVRRILTVKYQLGLFEDPYRYCDTKREQTDLLTKEHLNIAREAAKKSIVLLKNENDLLPLAKKGQSIAVIGSLASSKDVPLGSWRAQAVENSAVSVLEGIRNAVADPNDVQYTKGYTLTKSRRAFIYELEFVNGDRSGFKAAIDLAKKVDVVVLAMGEDCWQSGEGRSQTDIGLKGDQMELMNELLKANKNIVVTLMNGRSLAIPELDEQVPAILEVWHLGSEAGNAIADVLFGDYNPSGKLPVSFPRNVGQCPIYYNHKNGGRPVTNPHDAGMVFWSHYTDSPNSPLYPFGYGLSYTSFEYSDLLLSSTEMGNNEQITATIKIKNTGKVAGQETVQFYIRDYVGSVTRPVKELKGFEKITLKPREEKEVKFTISYETLSYYRADLTFGSEPGRFAVMIGGDSQKTLTTDFRLVD